MKPAALVRGDGAGAIRATVQKGAPLGAGDQGPAGRGCRMRRHAHFGSLVNGNMNQNLWPLKVFFLLTHTQISSMMHGMTIGKKTHSKDDISSTWGQLPIALWGRVRTIAQPYGCETFSLGAPFAGWFHRPGPLSSETGNFRLAEDNLTFGMVSDAA